MRKCRSYGMTSSIYNFFIIWPSSVTLTFNLHEQMSQTALLLLKRNSWIKFFWNPCINDSYDLHKLNVLPFYQLTFKCDLDLQPVWRNVSNGTATLQREQLCHIILKSIYKCRSYGPDKLYFDHFIIWPSSVTLIFNLSWEMFQMALLLFKENNCAKLFWNSYINVEVMARTSSIYDHFIIWP